MFSCQTKVNTHSRIVRSEPLDSILMFRFELAIAMY